jgi:hypothetical protein
LHDFDGNLLSQKKLELFDFMGGPNQPGALPDGGLNCPTSKRAKRAKVVTPLEQSLESDKLERFYSSFGEDIDIPMLLPSRFQPPVLAGEGHFCQASQMFALLLKFPRKLADIASRRVKRFMDAMDDGRCNTKKRERDLSFGADVIGNKFIVDPLPDEWPPGFEKLQIDDVMFLDKEWIVERPTGKGKQKICIRGTHIDGDSPTTKPRMFAHLVCESECLYTVNKREDFVKTLLECIAIKDNVPRGKMRLACFVGALHVFRLLFCLLRYQVGDIGVLHFQERY